MDREAMIEAIANAARAVLMRDRAAIRAEAFEEAAQYHDRAAKRALAAINAYSNFEDDGEQRLLALRHARYAAAIRALAAKEPAADA